MITMKQFRAIRNTCGNVFLYGVEVGVFCDSFLVSKKNDYNVQNDEQSRRRHDSRSGKGL